MIEARTLLVRRATRLGWFTVAWSQALLGFGLDSGIESISASILLGRLYAERHDPDRVEHVERRAVKVIGFSFFILATFVAVDAIHSLRTTSEPSASPVGIALTALSLVVMLVLAQRKRQVGREMGTRSVETDSKQTSACAYLSAVVLIGLVLNAWLGWWWADPVAALGVVVLLVREGREALSADHVDDRC